MIDDRPMDALREAEAASAAREADLAYEYAARVHAEARAEVWHEVAAFYADHSPECRIIPGEPATCTCGYGRSIAAAMAADAAALPIGAYARLVALGRAALAYERARGTPAAPDARAAYLEALRAAMGEDDHAE